MVAVNLFFSALFYKLGYSIGKYPKFYIILPVIATLTLSTGILRFNFVNDIEYLFTLKNGQAQKEKSLYSKYFPFNSTEKFTPSRLIEVGRFARFHITSKNGGSLLNSKTWSEIMEVDLNLRKVSIDWNDGQKYNYSQLCATWKGECYQNTHLGLGALLDRIQNGSLRLNYPVMFNPETYDTYALVQYFGGFTFQNGSKTNVESIKAIDIIYPVKTDTEDQKSMGLNWEYAVVDHFLELESHWKSINVAFGTYMSHTIEPQTNTFMVIPYFIPSVVLLLFFVMGTSLTGDWVTSKPWVSIMGLVSCGLGAIGSFGVLCYIGVEFIGLNLAIPFIALGVGMDDTFVVLASWWKTSPTDSVPQRMAHCYSDAAVSITITTLTDMLSFYVGILSSAPCIQIFCTYAGTVVLFIYFWHLFFFGGILALSGYHEQENRHSLAFWRKAIPKSEADHLAGFSRWFLVGGQDVESTTKLEKPKENVVMTFFKTSFAPFLEKTSVKVTVILLYILYVGVSIYGFTKLDEGLKTVNLVHTKSYMHEFFTRFDEYFREYPYRMQVIVTTPLDYSQKENQEKVFGIIGNLSSLHYTTSEYQENWLKDFLRFVDNYKEFYVFNITTEQEFIATLRTYYLTNTSYYSEDVKFNEDFTKIVATRYIIQMVNVTGPAAEKDVLVESRKIADGAKDLEVTVYHPYFVLFEMTVELKSMTVTLVGIAAAIVMIVAVIFIPSLSSSFCVFFSIASIELGVLGFMVLWGIDLDLLSVITLIMCIGFSIDFPAHVSYAYISSKFGTPEERVRDTLHSLGLPILQGAASTLIAVSALIVVNSYVFQLFLKIVTLVIVFSVFHGLFVLPVLLLIFKPEATSMCSRTKIFVINA